MRAGKTSEGYEQLAGVTFSDLQAISDVEYPERVAMRVQSIIERQPRAEGDDDCFVMEALVRAGKRGDHDASDLLMFGDLQVDRACGVMGMAGRYSGSYLDDPMAGAP